MYLPTTVALPAEAIAAARLHDTAQQSAAPNRRGPELARELARELAQGARSTVLPIVR
jgi:hypothetical protein